MAIKNATLALIIPAIFFSIASAEDIPQDLPAEPSGNDGKGDLNLNKAYLELFYSKDDIRAVRKKSDSIDRELEGTADFSESFKPLEKAVQTVDKIYLHPKRSVTVMLPAGAQITRVTPTFDSKFIEYDEQKPTNVFTILSMPAFVSGDLTIYYTMGAKNFIMKLICEKYSQTKDVSQTYHAVISYRAAKAVAPFDIMEAYKKEYGVYPARQYSFITVDGVAYKIIADDLYGTLTAPNGKKYRIESQVNQRN
jgi:hypothetical protein